MQTSIYPIYGSDIPIHSSLSKDNLALELKKIKVAMQNMHLKTKEKDLINCILGTYFNELEHCAKELEYQLIQQTQYSVIFYIWCKTTHSESLKEAVEHCNPIFLDGGIDKLLQLFNDCFNSSVHPYHTLSITNIVKQTLSPIEIEIEQLEGQEQKTKFIHKIHLME